MKFILPLLLFPAVCLAQETSAPPQQGIPPQMVIAALSQMSGECSQREAGHLVNEIYYRGLQQTLAQQVTDANKQIKDMKDQADKDKKTIADLTEQLKAAKP